MNSFTLQHQIRPHSVIMTKRRQNIAQTTKMVKHLSILANVSKLLFLYSFSIILVFSHSIQDLRYPVIELSQLLNSVQSRAQPCLLNPSLKLPDKSQILKSFLTLLLTCPMFSVVCIFPHCNE